MVARLSPGFGSLLASPRREPSAHHVTVPGGRRNDVPAAAAAVDRLPPVLRQVLLATSCMLLLAVVVFPDVLLAGRTTATSAFSPGVQGSPPHAAYPADAVLNRNGYLRDPLASAIASEPAAEYAARIPEDPGLALWDPHRSLGSPVLATGNPQVTSPIRWPLAAMPTPVGWDVFIVLRLVAAGVLVHLLAWRMGLSRWACVTSAVVAAAGGFTVMHVNSVHVDQLVALGLGMHAVLSFARARTPAWLLAVGVTGAMVLVADNLQAGLLGLAFLSAWAWHLLRREPVDRPWAVAALVGVVPVLLAAVVLLPLLELAGTPLTDGLSFHRHQGARRLGLSGWSTPFLADLLVPHVGHGTGRGIRMDHGLGLVVAFLALLGARRPSAQRAFLVGAAALMLAKLFTVPPVQWLGALPVADGINFILYLAAPLQLVVALLAGAGIERLRERTMSPWEVVLTATAVGAAAAALVVWVTPAEVDRTGLLATHLVLLALTAAVLVAGVRRERTTAWPSAAATVLVVMQVGLLWVPQLGAVVYDDQVEGLLGLEPVDRPVRSDPFAAPPFVRELTQRADAGDRLVARGGLLYPNTAGVFELNDLRGIGGFTVSRFHTLLVSFLDSREPWRFDGRGWDGLLDPAADPRLPEVLDLLGVEWVVSHGRLPDVPERRRYPELEVAFSGPVAVLYRNPDAQERAFVVHDVVAVDSTAAALQQMRDPRLDLRRTVVLETDDPPATAPPATAASTRILELSAARLRFEVDTPTPGVLVVSDTYYPGWRAEVDGESAEVVPADVALRGVAVPAGTSTVELVFRPTSVLIGAAVSSLTLLALLVATALRSRRRRTRGRPSRRRSGHAGTT